MAHQRLLLMDLDNTLIDRAALFRGWAVDFLERHGLEAREVDWLVERDGDGLVAKDVFFDQVRARYGLDAETEALGRLLRALSGVHRPAVSATLEALATLRNVGGAWASSPTGRRCRRRSSTTLG